jgi:hypothetical protein
MSKTTTEQQSKKQESSAASDAPANKRVADPTRELPSESYGGATTNPPAAPPSISQQNPPAAQQAPTGFMTIHVRVPFGLGPDRNMIVDTTLGYQAQIVVPYGIQPGAIVPVFVPTSPLWSYYMRMVPQPPPAYHPYYSYPNQPR